MKNKYFVLPAQALMKGKCSYLSETERLTPPPAAAPPHKIVSSAGEPVPAGDHSNNPVFSARNNSW